MINIGLIGAGRIGQIHAENILTMPHVQVKTVSDLVPEKIKVWAESVSIPNVTNRVEDIFEDPSIDAVLICSSTHTHTDLIERAAVAGKHVFCEKPISFNIQQTKRAVEAIKQAKLQFQTGFNRRFDPNFSRVREWITEGRIGEPHIIKITSRDPAPPPYEYIKVSGGLFIDMAIHDFDMARFLSGSEVEEVSVAGAVLIDPMIGELDDIDTAITTLRFKNGSLAVIDNSRKAAYGYDQRVEVFGSEGQVNVQNQFPNSAELSNGQGVFKDKPQYFFLERYKESYLKEIKSFIDAIRCGDATPVTGEDGYQAELIALAAKTSLAEQRPVKISEMA
ncbi:inositol 2-dehydrogenase [Paenibacillus chungangensis]|uniref:Inositol 2-dehydrogenase n=1 Tax=Paenibacillus chungangensis TaxID=696535 RepID=A0ABW3HL72_9BACL